LDLYPSWTTLESRVRSLPERGIIVSYEAIRRWCWKFGPDYARGLKKKQGGLGDTWYLDEFSVRINVRRQYLWRAVDQDGEVLDAAAASPRSACSRAVSSQIVARSRA
jgi:putative transposase